MDYQNSYLVQDPAVPMIQLPASFRPRRINAEFIKDDTGYADVAVIRGSGCIRHIWLLIKDQDRLQITVDDAPEPQVDMPVQSFFGVLLGQKPYMVDNAAFTVLPNYETPEMPGHPGYNCYLPIPFEKSCRIRVLYNTDGSEEGHYITGMIDWQEYENGPVTPFRFGAKRTFLTPAPRRGGEYTVVDLEGEGFLAGITQGFRQVNHSDMIYHTGGMSMLLDGETEPNPIFGHNVEDDYGFTWGMHPIQSKWVGCPSHRWNGRCDQDGVLYRFFGTDPVYFRSSLSFRCGCRDDDVESVAYYYTIPGTASPKIETPDRWEVIGMMKGGDDPEAFGKRDDLTHRVEKNGKTYAICDSHAYQVLTVPRNRGWLNFRYAGYETDYFYTYRNCSAYGRAVLHEKEGRKVQLKLSFGHDLILWVNGREIYRGQHPAFGTELVPVKLEAGDNEILIKTNCLTRQPFNSKIWAIHVCIQEDGKTDPGLRPVAADNSSRTWSAIGRPQGVGSTGKAGS